VTGDADLDLRARPCQTRPRGSALCLPKNTRHHACAPTGKRRSDQLRRPRAKAAVAEAAVAAGLPGRGLALAAWSGCSASRARSSSRPWLVVGYFVMPAERSSRQVLGADHGRRRCPGAGRAGRGQHLPGVARERQGLRLLARRPGLDRGRVDPGLPGQGALPSYGRAPGAYATADARRLRRLREHRRLRRRHVGRSGRSTVPADRRLYIDPGFYDVMERRLKRPRRLRAGLRARARGRPPRPEPHRLVSRKKCAGRDRRTRSPCASSSRPTASPASGATRRAPRSQITDDDLARGDCTPPTPSATTRSATPASATTPTAPARSGKRWFRRGFDTGDARKCDTFGVEKYADL
jgi:hypothetical protein